MRITPSSIVMSWIWTSAATGLVTDTRRSSALPALTIVMKPPPTVCAAAVARDQPFSMLIGPAAWA